MSHQSNIAPRICIGFFLITSIVITKDKTVLLRTCISSGKFMQGEFPLVLPHQLPADPEELLNWVRGPSRIVGWDVKGGQFTQTGIAENPSKVQ